jgi:hypothetical protein
MLISGIMNAQASYKTETKHIRKKIFEIYKSLLVDGLGYTEKILPTL